MKLKPDVQVVGTKREGAFFRFLDFVERVGDRLPHPFTLFWILAAFLVLISAIGSSLGWQVTIPGKTEVTRVASLMTPDGLRWFLENIPKNFINFVPVGVVLVMTMMIGIGEESGLFSALLRKVLTGVPRTYITAGVLFAGVIGNLASDAGIVLLPALGALVFHAVGRNPIVGLCAAYAGVAGGYTANVLIANADVVSMGITEAADKIYPSGIQFHPAINWYFMIAATFVLTAVGVWITEKVIEPRVQSMSILANENVSPTKGAQLSADERRGLKFADIASAIYLVILLILTVPPNALLRDPKTHTILPNSPFMKSIFPILVIFFFVIGLAYGVGARSIRSDKDLAKFMSKGLQSSAGFYIVAFAAAQFVNMFQYTNLGPIMAIKGAEWLKSMQLGDIPIVVAFILLTAFINLFVYSMSAKWALLAPIFVPMFTLLGLNPALTQAAYRIADSATNPITPLFAFAPVILNSFQKYKENAGMGTLISLMLPYSIAFLIFWTLLLVVFMVFNIPLGPGMLPRL